jgi:hypothetical protein
MFIKFSVEVTPPLATFATYIQFVFRGLTDAKVCISEGEKQLSHIGL